MGQPRVGRRRSSSLRAVVAAFLGLEPRHRSAVEPPRGRPGEGPVGAPFEIAYLDPANGRFPILKPAA